jgi:hypothetical protein
MDLCFKNPPADHKAIDGPTYTRVTSPIEDPHIDMRTIRVTFMESKYNYTTQINGTRESIARYFQGAPLNLSSDDTNEIIRTARAIEFLPEHEKGQTLVMFL